jgi:toxin HigB-1
MIRNFKHRGLEKFFTTGSKAGIPAASAARIEKILDVLDASVRAADMNLPGMVYHPLSGVLAGRSAVKVTANWRITYAWDGADAIDVDLVDYH